ncbi:MAG: hypothetical protein ACRDNK_05935 [Solirubrobacteraceae bacterium]
MSPGRARPALVLFALLALALVPAVAQAGWSPPFDLVAPGTLDYLPTQLAVSRSGSAAGYAVQDVDAPGSAQAYLVLRSPGGRVGPSHAIAGAREILALAYSSRGLELLTGSSPPGQDCCSSTQALAVAGAGRVRSAQTLVSGLTGATIGSLVALAHGGLLAVVTTEGGLWAQQAGSGGRFHGQHRLTGAGLAPQAVSATSLGGADSLVAWTAASGPAGFADPRTIFYAQGSKRSSPRRAQTLLRVPAGHRIDELGVAQRGAGATAAWIESYYDKRAGYHVQVRATDFAKHPNVRGFSAAGSLAAGLAFAADSAGAQGLAWKACDGDGNCTVRVATRGPSSPFRSPMSLGSIDAAQTPALSVSPHGQVVVGWVRGGHPVAAVGPARSGRFGAVRVLSPSVYALDETVAYGPSGALAAWTQGTLNPSVVAAAYR